MSKRCLRCKQNHYVEHDFYKRLALWHNLIYMYALSELKAALCQNLNINTIVLNMKAGSVRHETSPGFLIDAQDNS